MTTVRTLGTTFFACLLVACATGEQTAKMDGVSTSGQVLAAASFGPGDSFEIRVYGEPDLSGDFRVASDGTIDFPLVGKLRVEGQNASQLSATLSQQLSRYIKQPDVSVFVKEFNSKKVFVFGEVKNPGTFPYEQGMNIIQAITMAGGFERLADQNGTFVTRVIEGKEERLQVPVKSIGKGDAANFALQPGDIVFVPETLF